MSDARQGSAPVTATRGFAWLQRPGAWFWVALIAGAVLRVYLVGFTEGTFDVSIKRHHGHQINALGLLEYYRRAEVFNHPPLMGWVFALIERMSVATGAPFPLLLRAPFALLDLGTALLLVRVFGPSPWRFAVGAAYWLNPLALIFSAYHGNTDSAIAFCIVLALFWATQRHAALAGAALGLGLWIKLPALVAAPALFFAFPGWRERWTCAAAALAVATLGWAPALLAEPALLIERVFGYPGTDVVTPRGIATWGVAHTLGLHGTRFAAALAAYNTWVCWTPLVAFAWLRRGEISPTALGTTLCGCCMILYGFTSFWAWQYLAWSVPLWFFVGPGFAVAATLLLGGYVYGAYALYTGSALLRGRWDFVNHADWPWILDLLRDASVLFCLGAGCALFAAAARVEWRRRGTARIPA